MMSGIDMGTTLLPLTPVCENPVSIMVYDDPAPQPTELMKASVLLLAKNPSTVSFPEGTVIYSFLIGKTPRNDISINFGVPLTSTFKVPSSWMAWTKRTSEGALEPQLAAKRLKAARAKVSSKVSGKVRGDASGRAFNQRNIFSSPKGSPVVSKKDSSSLLDASPRSARRPVPFSGGRSAWLGLAQGARLRLIEVIQNYELRIQLIHVRLVGEDQSPDRAFVGAADYEGLVKDWNRAVGWAHVHRVSAAVAIVFFRDVFARSLVGEAGDRRRGRKALHLGLLDVNIQGARRAR